MQNIDSEFTQSVEKSEIEKLNISSKVLDLACVCEKKLENVFVNIDNIALNNTAKVINAFWKNKISEVHFASSTGYGYGDVGREAIERVYADIFHTESALVRVQFVNGTHALSCALFGNLKPGDTMLSITGAPYDTLAETIGLGNSNCSMSLKNIGVGYEQIDLKNNEIDLEELKKILSSKKISLVFIGRSRGYSTRESLSIEKIAKAIKCIKEVSPLTIVMVDNCYGELVEKMEPTDVGADIIAGSLIKNLGGGICQTGAYIAGKKEYVENAANRLTAPGIGSECGATLGQNRNILQGLFMAPSVVKNALKSAVFLACMLEELGYIVSPMSCAKRMDIIQAVEFGNKEKLISFIQGIQMASPVDSHVVPYPWAMPGYTDEVIMAAGTFISGASIELSSDAPIKEPYMAYVQGGLTYESAKIAICVAITKMLGDNK